MLRTAGALQEVGDATALAAALQHLIAHPQEARSMADAGLAVMKANQGALQRLLDGIGRLMARR